MKAEVWDTVFFTVVFGVAVAVASIYAASLYPDTLKESKP